MRVLVITRFYRNGQTTHVLTLCAELLRQGHQVFLIISQLDCPNYASWLQKLGIPYSKHDDPRRLSGLLHRWQPDLIHNHSGHTLPASTRLGEILQIPTLTTTHYLDFEPKELLAKQAAVVVISKEMQDLFQLPVPTFLVENGIPLPRKFGKSKFTKQALFLAQVSANKENNFAKMATSLLAWGWKVKSAGNWRYPGVSYVGWVNDVWPLLQQTDLVIGTGRAVREGMGSACAAWVLGEYSDGLVTPRNVQALRATNFSGRSQKMPFDQEKAASYLQDPDEELFHQLGSFGRDYAEKNFSIETVVRRLSHIYAFVLKNPHPQQALKTGKSRIMSKIIRKGGTAHETGDHRS